MNFRTLGSVEITVARVLDPARVQAAGGALTPGDAPGSPTAERLPIPDRSAAACRSHPRTGVIVRMNAPSPMKENTVSKPIAVVRNWAIEQVTAIVSVCRPIHLDPRTR